ECPRECRCQRTRGARCPRRPSSVDLDAVPGFAQELAPSVREFDLDRMRGMLFGRNAEGAQSSGMCIECLPRRVELLRRVDDRLTSVQMLGLRLRVVLRRDGALVDRYRTLGLPACSAFRFALLSRDSLVVFGNRVVACTGQE